MTLRRVNADCSIRPVSLSPHERGDDWLTQGKLLKLKSFGNIDAFGYSPSMGAFIFIGWIDLQWDETVELAESIVRGDGGEVTGSSTVCLYPREDVRKLGSGFVIFTRTETSRIGNIVSLKIWSNDTAFELFRSDPCPEYKETEIIPRAKQWLKDATPNASRGRLKTLLERQHYTGRNTINEVSTHVHFEIDSANLCMPHGIVLVGWFIDPFSEVSNIRLRCGSFSSKLSQELWISVSRPDVIQGFQGRVVVSDDQIGFVAFAAECYDRNATMYTEIEFSDGKIAFRPVEVSFLSGLPAIKSFLGSIEIKRHDISNSFNNVIGPAVEAMNAFRLRSPPTEILLRYGPIIEMLRASLIIPLYGRIDFLEYQLAFFSGEMAEDHEVIYVLDDPQQREEVETIAKSCFAKFQRPFTLIILTHNVGYAPANNVGLRHARGDYVCYLNSDVFPDNSDWLECLIATEKTDPSIGIVGALLVYEDETIQHRGCEFERVAEYGDWWFVVHPDKGRRIAPPRGPGAVLATTGACMLMKRDLAVRLGGFDEDYVIGDFEDADLCLRARALGFSCVVDYRARLYHLERQSQGQSQPWRTNLTLYNAWRFQRRWQDNDL